MADYSRNLALGGFLSQLLGGAAGFGGDLSQAGAMSGQAGFSRDSYLLNARYAELQAQQAVEAGNATANMVAGKASGLIGQQRAVGAASGVNVNTGSQTDLMADSERQSAADQATIKSNAWREAMGYDFEAGQDKMKADMAERAGKTNAGNTILTGGLRFASTILGASSTLALT